MADSLCHTLNRAAFICNSHFVSHLRDDTSQTDSSQVNKDIMTSTDDLVQMYNLSIEHGDIKRLWSYNSTSSSGKYVYMTNITAPNNGEIFIVKAMHW